MNWHLVYEQHLILDPQPKLRPRFTRSGRVYTPSKTVLAEQAIARQVRSDFKLKPFEGALGLKLVFWMKKPKKTKNLYPIVKPDLDNMAKLIKDALNGILWKDDSQIILLNCEKYYAETGSIEMHLCAMGR